MEILLYYSYHLDKEQSLNRVAFGEVAGMVIGTALRWSNFETLALANLIRLVIPRAMDAQLNSLFFWGSLASALIIAAITAFPVNRWLIARGRGHTLAQAYH